MSITNKLFPPANREAAVVAGLRTFWQTVRGTGYLGGGGLIVITAGDLAHIDLLTVGYTAGAVLASGILSGAMAAGNILANGLPAAYTDNTPVLATDEEPEPADATVQP